MFGRKISWIRATTAMVAALGLGLFTMSCGGGGSSLSSSNGTAGLNSSNNSSGASTPTPLFIQDAMNTGYSHVWVTIQQVTLLNGTQSTTIFNASSIGGVVVDLASLHDPSGERFLLLGGCRVPTGSYTGINFVLSPTLTVYPTGATTGTTATFAGAGSMFNMGLTFPSATTLGRGNSIVLDFDLANWTLSGGTVTASNNAWLAVGNTTGLTNPSQQNPSDYTGAISAVAGTAPAQTFTLTQGTQTETISTSSSTVISYQDGTASPTLANGETVDVVGTYDTSTGAIDATSITISPATMPTPTQYGVLEGLVTADDSTSGTITATVTRASRFIPASTAETILTNANTVFLSPNGDPLTASAFFADLTTGTSTVAAEGTVSSSGLTATTIRLENAPPAVTHLATFQGMVGNTSSSAGTFDLTVQAFNGWFGRVGVVVHVTTGSSTTFTAAGATSTSSAFFAALSSNSIARVEGTFDQSTMTIVATEVDLRGR